MFERIVVRLLVALSLILVSALNAGAGNVKPYLKLDFNGGLNGMKFKRGSIAVTSSGSVRKVDEPVFVKGIYGKAIYLGSASENLLSKEATSCVASEKGLVGLGKSVLTKIDGKKVSHAKIAVSGDVGSGVGTAVVDVSQGKEEWYVGSAYLAGEGRVLLYLEDVESGIWGVPRVLNLKSGKWKRAASKIAISAPSAKLRLVVVSLEERASVFFMRMPQIERSIGGMQGWPSPWMPGGVKREADSVEGVFPDAFPVSGGAISFWFKPKWSSVRLGYSEPIHHFFSSSKYFDLTFRANQMPKSTMGVSLKNGAPAYCGFQWRLLDEQYHNFNKPNWHLWTVVWKDGSVVCYLDGKRFGDELKDVKLFGSDPSGKKFILGALTPDSIVNADSAVDEFLILRSSPSPEDVWRMYADGLKKIGITANKRYFKPLPLSDSMKKRVEVWKRRGLKMGDAWSIFAPSVSASKAYQFPLLGRIRKLADKFMYTNASAVFMECDEKYGRFKGVPGWASLHHSDNPAAKLRSGIFGSHIFDKGDKAHTFSSWIYVDDVLQTGGAILKDGGASYGFGMGLNHGTLSHYVTSGGKTVSVNFRLTPEQVGKWLHVVGVYDGKKETVSLYLNGKIVAEKKNIGIPELKLPGRPLAVGTFLGVLDELVIWDKALGGARIAELFKKGAPDNERLSVSLKDANKPPVAAVARSGSDADSIAVDDIYMYVPFDRTAEPELSDSNIIFRCKYVRTYPSEKRFEDRSKERMSEQGRFGKGVPIRKTEKWFEGLAYMIPSFPQKEGAISFWFKPEKENASGNLWAASWVNWMATLNAKGKLITTFAGKKKNGRQNPLNGKTSTIASGKWCLYSASWNKDGEVSVYLNGQRIAKGVSPVRVNGWALGLGGIGQPTAVQRPNLMMAGMGRCLNAVFDDLLITRKALSAELVARLYNDGKPASEFFRGISFTGVRTAFFSSEKISIPVVSRGVGTTVLTIKQGTKTVTRLAVDESQNGRSLFTFSPHSFAPGKYKQILQLLDGKRVLVSVERPFIVNDDYMPPVRMGMYGGGKYSVLPDFESIVKRVRIRSIISGSMGVGMPKTLDKWFKCGMLGVPALFYDQPSGEFRRTHKVEEYGQLTPDGKWHQHLSVFSPMADEYKRNAIKTAIENSKGTPTLKALSFWDEYAIFADVSPHAVAAFKKRYGRDAAPKFRKVSPGTVLDDDDPLVEWVDLMGDGMWMNQRLARSDAKMTAYARTLKPGIETMAMPSSGFAGTTLMVAEVYPYLIETPSNRMWSNSDMIAETILEGYFSSVSEREKYPTAILPGWLNFPSEKAADASLAIMCGIGVAKGVRSCIPAPASWLFTRPDMRKSFKRFSDFCFSNSATLAELDRDSLPRIAIYLNPLNQLKNKKWWFSRLSLPMPFYQKLLPSMRLSGLNPVFIRDSDLKNGVLSKCDAVFLYKTDVISKSALTAISGYARKGGRVFIMPKSKIKIEGAMEVPFLGDHQIVYGYESFNRVPDEPWRKVAAPACWVPQIRSEITAFLKKRAPAATIKSDSSMLAMYQAVKNENRYLFVINPDRYEAHGGIVELAHSPAGCFDLTAEKRVKVSGNKKSSLFATGDLSPGEWRVYLVAEKIPAEAACSISVDGGAVKYSVAMTDGAGVKINGAWPATISLVSADGKTLAVHSLAMGTPSSKGVFHIAKFAEKKKGMKLVVRDMATGKTEDTPF